MENIFRANYKKILPRRIASVAVITLAFVVVSLILTLIQPFRYESQVKVLVIQKSAVTLDAYSASKSAERIGRNLSQIVYSSSFFNKVFNSGFGIDKSYFVADETKRRDQWQKLVSVDVPSNTTILDISVFHPKREQATMFAQAISYVLVAESADYIGISDVELKVVDGPVTSKYPVRPNIFLNLGLGFLVGILFSLAYAIITYTEEHLIEEIYHPHGGSNVKPEETIKEVKSKEIKTAVIHHEKVIPPPVIKPVARVEEKKVEPAVAIPQININKMLLEEEDEKPYPQPPKIESRPSHPAPSPVAPTKPAGRVFPSFKDDDEIISPFDK